MIYVYLSLRHVCSMDYIYKHGLDLWLKNQDHCENGFGGSSTSQVNIMRHISIAIFWTYHKMIYISVTHDITITGTCQKKTTRGATIANSNISPIRYFARITLSLPTLIMMDTIFVVHRHAHIDSMKYGDRCRNGQFLDDTHYIYAM